MRHGVSVLCDSSPVVLQGIRREGMNIVVGSPVQSCQLLGAVFVYKMHSGQWSCDPI